MKFLVVLSSIVVGVLSAALVEDATSAKAALRALPALEFKDIRDKLGQYVLRYVTAEGIVVTQRGRLVPNPDGTDYVLVTDGDIIYTGDDDQIYTYKFRAGIDGYHVEGNHLLQQPQPESVPESGAPIASSNCS